MATTIPYAINTGSTINGTEQIGNIAIGTGTTLDYSQDPGGVKWWMGPDEDLGYVICVPDLNVGQSTPIGINSGVKFWRSSGFTDNGFLAISNNISQRQGYTGFTNTTDAVNWFDNVVYYPHIYGYELEIYSYISGLSTRLSRSQKGLISDFVYEIKDGFGINTLDEAFDDILLLAGETPESSLRNLVKRNHDAIAVNSPTFTQYLGFTTSGTNYINTKYSYLDNVRFKQGTSYDSMVSIYSNDGSSLSYLEGTRLGGYYWVDGFGSTGGTLRIDDVNTAVTTTAYSGNHLLCYGRNGATTVRVIRFDESHSEVSGFTNNYTDVAGGERYLLCVNNIGTAFWSSPRPTASLYVLSKCLTYDEATIIWNAFRNYLTAHGTD